MKESFSHMTHVMLADDDRDHTFLFQRVLKKVDPERELTTVHDGAALMERLAQEVPDILFLDLAMPGKNGMECLQEIRQHPDLKHLPVVVYSCSARMTDIQKAYLHQASLYMVKPFLSEHLHHALASVLTIDEAQNKINPNHYFINNRFVPFTAAT